MTSFAFAVASWSLGAILAMAALHKLRTMERFPALLQAYRLLPPSWSRVAAYGVAVSELAVALGLFALFEAALVSVALLLALYAAAMAINLGRGHRAIDCGCGDEPVPLSWALVLRNGVLVLLALGALALERSEPLTAAPAATAGAVALLVFGVYLIVEQLFANAGRFRTLREGAQ